MIIFRKDNITIKLKKDNVAFIYIDGKFHTEATYTKEENINRFLQQQGFSLFMKSV